MDDILQCLIDSAAPYIEDMKRAQRIPVKGTFMSMSVDSTRFLFKESEKKVLDHEASGGPIIVIYGRFFFWR